MPTVAEYYDEASLPRDSLSRLAGQVKSRGALYVGGGVGVEATASGKYRVIGGGTHDGPLSALTQALTLAGGMEQAGTPGGTTKVSEPAVAARLYELAGQQAEEEGTVARMQRILARNTKDPLPYSSSMNGDDDRWERRRIREAEERIKQIQAERRALLAGKIKEAAMVAEGKPGTNWKQVAPDDRKRVSGLVKHYMGKPHPFTACVADNSKRFGPERAAKVCAVVKDMGKRSTSWRKGGKVQEGVDSIDAQAFAIRLYEAAGGDLEGVEAMMLAHIAMAEGLVPPADPLPGAGRRRARAFTRAEDAVLGEAIKGDRDNDGIPYERERRRQNGKSGPSSFGGAAKPAGKPAAKPMRSGEDPEVEAEVQRVLKMEKDTDTELFSKKSASLPGGVTAELQDDPWGGRVGVVKVGGKEVDRFSGQRNAASKTTAAALARSAKTTDPKSPGGAQSVDIDWSAASDAYAAQANKSTVQQLRVSLEKAKRDPRRVQNRAGGAVLGEHAQGGGPTGQSKNFSKLGDIEKVKGTASAPYVNRYLKGKAGTPGARAVHVQGGGLGQWEARLLDISKSGAGVHMKTVPIKMGKWDEATADAAARKLLGKG